MILWCSKIRYVRCETLYLVVIYRHHRFFMTLTTTFLVVTLRVDKFMHALIDHIMIQLKKSNIFISNSNQLYIRKGSCLSILSKQFSIYLVHMCHISITLLNTIYIIITFILTITLLNLNESRRICQTNELMQELISVSYAILINIRGMYHTHEKICFKLLPVLKSNVYLLSLA